MSILSRVPLIALFVFACPRIAYGQGASRMAILTGVSRFRQVWLGDSAKLAACNVFDALGAERVSATMPPNLRRALTDTTENCAVATAPWVGIVVDSVIVTNDSASVHTTTWRGEYRYSERYSLVRSPFAPRNGTPIWNVVRVAIFSPMIVDRMRRPNKREERDPCQR